MTWGIWTMLLPLEIGKEFELEYAQGARIIGLYMPEDPVAVQAYIWGDMDPDTPLVKHRFVWQGTGENTLYKPWKWEPRGQVHNAYRMQFLFEY